MKKFQVSILFETHANCFRCFRAIYKFCVSTSPVSLSNAENVSNSSRPVIFIRWTHSPSQIRNATCAHKNARAIKHLSVISCYRRNTACIAATRWNKWKWKVRRGAAPVSLARAPRIRIETKSQRTYVPLGCRRWRRCRAPVPCWRRTRARDPCSWRESWRPVLCRMLTHPAHSEHNEKVTAPHGTALRGARTAAALLGHRSGAVRWRGRRSRAGGQSHVTPGSTRFGDGRCRRSHGELPARRAAPRFPPPPARAPPMARREPVAGSTSRSPNVMICFYCECYPIAATVLLR